MSEQNDAALRWLEDHVEYDGDGCLTWPFYINRFWGRGQLTINGTTTFAHRHMCRLVHGDPPPDQPYAAHECGNGHLACVHPKHLFWKSSSDNAKDRRRHGRPEGAGGTRTHLTPDQVAEIRAAEISQFALAEKFGISRGSVEYWQRTNHEPLAWSLKPFDIQRRGTRKKSQS